MAIVVAVVLSAVLEVLDSTIVNVAIPHIKAAFGATNVQITWVLTSYIVAAVVVMPLTGLLARRLGRRRLLLTAVGGFALMSAACGLATSLEGMVVFRMGQGLFGAFLIPLSQAILFDAFPKEKRGQAMALFGLGVVVAPVLGPTLGALLTEYFSWRMVFFVNLPVAGLALSVLAAQLPHDEGQPAPIDWPGLILMAAAIGALQFTLDQGAERDWFESPLVQASVAASAWAAFAFLLLRFDHPAPVIDLSLFKDRNFALANVVMAGFAVAMFGGIAILPLFVQGLIGYPVMLAGYLFIPRGLAAGFSMVITGSVLSRRFDPRLLATVGLALTAAGNWLTGRLTLEVGFWDLALPGVVAGLGMGLVFVPMSTMAFDSISRERQTEASGLYGVTRQLGSSIGIAVVGALLTHATGVATARLGENVTPYSEAARAYLQPLGLSPESAQGAAMIEQVLATQASLQGFLFVFDLLAIQSIALVPLLWLMHRPKAAGGEGPAVH
ncbi:DHA2 family efflux MFS transporter permease subunit [Rubellimicrobium arenae]|uniref:DHA2 family efflux MFS transporter permease subunit n=1 Tax=Rubellimicrobium arenae TaxID=2817372 RepID=UPI0034A1F08A